MDMVDSHKSVKVYVRRAYDHGWEDLSNIRPHSPYACGVDVGVSWACGIDSPMTATVNVQRGDGYVSLAPEMTRSRINNEYLSGDLPDQLFEYVPLLDGHKEIVIQVADVPDPQLYEYQTVFQGRISAVSWADEVITVSCAGSEQQSAEALIESDIMLAGEDEANAAVGTTSVQITNLEGHNFVVGDTLILFGLPATTADQLNGFELTITSITSSTITSVHGLTISGGDTGNMPVVMLAPFKQELDKLIQHAPLADGVPLEYRVDESVDWAIVGYTQQREELNNAIQNLVAQFGGVAKEVFDAGVGRPVLTIFAPDFEDTTPEATLGNELLNYTSFGMNVNSVRNRITVSIDDLSSVQADGSFAEYTTTVNDTNSQARFGIRTGIIDGARGLAEPVDADLLAAVLLNDLSKGSLEASAVGKLMRNADLFSYIEILPDGIRQDTTKTWGINGYSSTIKGAEATTTLALSSTISSRYKYWVNIPGLRMKPLPQKPLGKGDRSFSGSRDDLFADESIPIQDILGNEYGKGQIKKKANHHIDQSKSSGGNADTTIPIQIAVIANVINIKW